MFLTAQCVQFLPESLTAESKHYCCLEYVLAANAALASYHAADLWPSLRICVEEGVARFCEFFVTQEQTALVELAFEGSLRTSHAHLDFAGIARSAGDFGGLLLIGIDLRILQRLSRHRQCCRHSDLHQFTDGDLRRRMVGATYAVVWSGLMNFLGVIIGGIAVAYALVELIPAEVLSPPDGEITAGMLTALFTSALLWNVGTWWLGIPNSSSHALIGSLVGIAIETALTHGRGLKDGVDWHQVWSVLGSLLLSPLLGFGLAFLLFKLLSMFIHDPHLYEPPEGDKPPIWWMRYLLILTYTGVSFSHGTNDGQKNIGLIMPTIIGLLPADYLR